MCAATWALREALRASALQACRLPGLSTVGIPYCRSSPLPPCYLPTALVSPRPYFCGCPFTERRSNKERRGKKGHLRVVTLPRGLTLTVPGLPPLHCWALFQNGGNKNYSTLLYLQAWLPAVGIPYRLPPSLLALPTRSYLFASVVAPPTPTPARWLPS